MVEEDDTLSSVLLIRGEKGNHTATFVAAISRLMDRTRQARPPALTFTRDENQYRLSGVWASGSEAWSLIESVSGRSSDFEFATATGNEARRHEHRATDGRTSGGAVDHGRHRDEWNRSEPVADRVRSVLQEGHDRWCSIWATCDMWTAPDSGSSSTRSRPCGTAAAR